MLHTSEWVTFLSLFLFLSSSLLSRRLVTVEVAFKSIVLYMLTVAELDVKEYTTRFCGSAPGVAAAVAPPRRCGMGVLHPPRLMSREFRGPGCLHRHRCCQHRGLADGGVRNVPARQAPDVTIPTLFRQRVVVSARHVMHCRHVRPRD